jgi:membrane protease YdiL (CAAX protease family)
MNKPHKGRSVDIINILLDIVTVGAIYLLAQFFSGIVLNAGGIQSSEDIMGKPGVVIAAYLTAGFVMTGALYAIIRTYGIKKDVLYIRRPNAGDVGYALAGFMIYLVATITAGVVLRFVPGVDVDQKQELGLEGVSSSLLPLVFLTLAVVPPLVEEFMFRGYLYQRLKAYRLGTPLAAVLVSVLFGLVHGQVNVAVDTFILSLIMIYTMEKRKNIWVAVMIHALKNTLAFLALFIFKWV